MTEAQVSGGGALKLVECEDVIGSARCRLMLYMYRLQEEVEVEPFKPVDRDWEPKTIQMNAELWRDQGLPVMLTDEAEVIPGCDAISTYLALRFPRYLQRLNTSQLTRGAAILSFHETRVLPLMGAICETEWEGRERSIISLCNQLDVLEVMMVGPYTTGKSISPTDMALFPTIALIKWICPRFFGWKEWGPESVFTQRPRMHAWWELMMMESGPSRVEEELQDVLSGWEEAGRWADSAVDVATSQFRKVAKHAW